MSKLVIKQVSPDQYIKPFIEESSTIKKLNVKLDLQENELTSLRNEVSILRDSIKQILCGLYSNSQTYLLSIDLALLYPEQESIIDKISESGIKDTSKWSNLFTTRQGDSNESRISDLEDAIDDLTVKLSSSLGI